MIYEVNNIADLFKLFPKTPDEIKFFKQRCIEDLDKHIEKILAIADNKRNFENTAIALDKIYYYYQPVSSTLQAIENLSPDEQMRNTAHNEFLALSDYYVDKISTNLEIYRAFKAYVDGNAKIETLNEQQRYFLDEKMKEFKKDGLDLPIELLEQSRKLNKEIAEIALNFERNIAESKCEVLLDENELLGVPQKFLTSLKKNNENKYIVGCDYPTYFAVMEDCIVETTRKKMYSAFFNRAYPENIDLLNELINKRDELSKLVGYQDYNHYALDDLMSKNPETVYKFLNDLIDKAIIKIQKELESLKSDLPESVKLTSNGKINPWDWKYLKTYYKRKYLNLDEDKIAEYFPMDHTIAQLLNIYEQFFNIKFLEVQHTAFWHEHVRLVEAYDKDTSELLGYILLDLFPRDNKFSHAAHMTLISAVNQNGKKYPSVGVVMANFPKPTSKIPSLLKFKDVETFFHEFGHAIHALFGSTNLYSFSGTCVKRDFVEMPSQMLEDWLSDREMLKLVSKNYKTGESLPDDLIDQIIHIEKFDSGDFIMHQSYYSLLSLDYFGPGKNKDTQEISKSLYNKILNYLQWSDDNHFQTSFGHLVDYGPSYYGYLWSKVFAKDLFYEIKKHGLLNSEIGKRYINQVIGLGGSKDPNQLLKDFLKRNVDHDSFFKDLGLTYQ